MPTPAFHLNGFTFNELSDSSALQRLDHQFLTQLSQQDKALYNQLLLYREGNKNIDDQIVSDILLRCASYLEVFLAHLFAIEEPVEKMRLQTLSHDPIFIFKKWYVQRQVKRRHLNNSPLESFDKLNTWLEESLAQEDITGLDKELSVAKFAGKHMDNAVISGKITDWCVQALVAPEGRKTVQGWVSFQQPRPLDSHHLVPIIDVNNDPYLRQEGPSEHYRQRDGFTLTDQRMSERDVLNEVNYCVYCHQSHSDFCSTGFPVKKGDPEQGLKANAFGEPMTGCPLEEKISEMHFLKKEGRSIAALAMIMLDNPMCPATGHRICNDCMKACIYQKQEPVNIPQIETGVLMDVLKLPWGVEIYDLLTRWNPLRKEQYLPKPYNGKKVMVMGMGPAGFSLAHHLLQEGFAVMGVDGLKIEPLPERFMKEPIYHYEDITEALDERAMAGFGGVAEYGITNRWDKNFLKLIYITLMRRQHFLVFGNVRFGGTITVEDAWELGFDHLAIAVGAGLPKELSIPGSLAPGMRQANDFLMALQLTGAAKKNTLANLQVRLPAVVIGGGLTGIDTATEVQAYYITQVKKTLGRYERLTEIFGEERVRQHFDEHALLILDEFLKHGRQVKAERNRALITQTKPSFINLIREWGGVTIAYRRLLQESPAYKRNHEEVIKALEEGIYYAEGLDPKAIILDQYGHVESIRFQRRILDEAGSWAISHLEHSLPARSIFVATGAKPNIAYEFENRGTFKREGMDYQAYDDEAGKLVPVTGYDHCKTKNFGAFTSYEKEDKRVSFLGDTHPTFHGSVVKAIASAKRIYPKIIEHLSKLPSRSTNDYPLFAEKIRYFFSAKITALRQPAKGILEIDVHAPIFVKNFKPGQFYRVQNFETYANQINDTLLQTEATALLGTKVDKKAGIISLTVFERGVSTRLFRFFKEGDSIALMGPTGVRTKIPRTNENVLIIGTQISLPQLLVVGNAMREAGNKVIYIGSFTSADEVYSQIALEEAADQIIWITTHGIINVNRPQDIAFNSDLSVALKQLADTHTLAFEAIDRILLVGSVGFLKKTKEIINTLLKPYLTKKPRVIASIYSVMQCMLKGVCAQCLQWQIDPKTGKRSKAVFACSWQDQPLELVDLDNLHDRLSQNRTQEILSNLWLDYLLSSNPG